MTTHDDTAGFVPENPYADEAKERWGHTDAYKQSQERITKMTKEEFEAIGLEGDAITKRIAALKHEGASPTDPRVQDEVSKHYAWLRHFYEPTVGMYRGLGSMYVDDPRFAKNFDRYADGLAVFLRDAMHAFCDEKTA